MNRPGLMVQKKRVPDRLHFIDALRAWAILMMLQGHFIAALLADSYRDTAQPIYAVWSYFRGITAPVFFTVSGFIFTFLLIREGRIGLHNPRVKKGVIRSLQLIGIGYVLQIRFTLLFQGTLHPSYNIVHVLQCLGMSILLLILLYLLCHRFALWTFQIVLVSLTFGSFLFKDYFQYWEAGYLPEAIGNYFTKVNGSVFTLFPWVGFATFGAFLAILFVKNDRKINFYPITIVLTTLAGFLLVSKAYSTISCIKLYLGNALVPLEPANSYLFEHLGAVLLIFAFFMACRSYLNQRILLTIGKKTLPIYVVHSIVLYGSISGHGLTRYYYHSLPLNTVLFFVWVFVFGISIAVIRFDKYRTILYKNPSGSTKR